MPDTTCLLQDDVHAEESALNTSRAAVLADANALLTCFGVGEESGTELLHAVVELCFTSSIRFLQPGLLLKVGSSLHRKGSNDSPDLEILQSQTSRSNQFAV